MFSNKSQKWVNDYNEACTLINKIRSSNEFYEVTNYLNNNLDIDAVMCAREHKHCYNSIIYNDNTFYGEKI